MFFFNTYEHRAFSYKKRKEVIGFFFETQKDQKDTKEFSQKFFLQKEFSPFVKTLLCPFDPFVFQFFFIRKPYVLKKSSTSSLRLRRTVFISVEEKCQCLNCFIINNLC